MHRPLKSILQDWMPPIIYRSLLPVVAELKFLSYAHKDILENNRTLEGMGKGKRAFLLATGPSINQENLKLLAGEDCFSISNFFLHNDIQTINPAFQGFAPYHKPLILENYVEWLRQADNSLPKRTKIVLGHKTYDIVQNYGLFPDREVYYLFLGSSERRCIDLLKPVIGPITGPLLMIPLMIYMGYEQIYLLGCDHTTIRDYKKELTNFYSPDKDVRKNATGKDAWIDIETEFRANLIIFKQYRFYRDILKGKSTSITNLSVDSWLEMFPFDRLEHVIRKV
jgi:hypothetical protein